jgi:prepilin-type N-terminal cleavage/methylation domain-containing protein
MTSPPASRRGLTLVELLAAMTAAAVLALTCGAMLVAFQRAWRRHAAYAGLERDAVAALDLIERHVRPLQSDAVTTGTGRLILDAGASRTAFLQSGNDLVFDPDTSRSHDEQTLVAGAVEHFSSTPFEGRVSVVLRLRDEGESVELSTTVAYRNQP